jgi:site-specific DNA recombinase
MVEVQRKVAIYARVSTPLPKGATEEQIFQLKRQDTDNQLVPLIAFCKKNGWEIFGQYVDNMSSTKTRPMLNSMMMEAREGKFDVVLVWKLDRFCRSLAEFTRLVTELHHSKVRFVVLTQNIDTDEQTPTGKLLMNMLACFAEFERSLIVERINSSIARRKAQGLPIGREKVVVNVHTILEMRRQGKSIRMIATELGVKRSTVENRLKEIEKQDKKFCVMVDECEEDWEEDVIYES